jgi:hypothetical protein
MPPPEDRLKISGFLITIWDFIVKGGKYIIGIFQIPQSPNMDPAERKIKIYDVVVKGIIGGVIVLTVTIIGTMLQTSQKRLADQEETNRLRIAENNKTINLLRELSAKQKEMDVDLGLQMFKTLMARYLQISASQEGKEARHQQMLLIRMISLNFQDSPINIKPLFEELDSQMTVVQEKKRLREIAMEEARHQAFRLTFQTGASHEEPVWAGKEIHLGIGATIKIVAVGKDTIKATLTSNVTPGNPTLGPFTVNYFDMPLNDNIKLGAWRISLLLLENMGETAKIRVVIFDSYLAPDRFDIKELTQEQRAKLLDNKEEP